MTGMQKLTSLCVNREPYDIYYSKVLLTNDAKYFLKAVNSQGGVIAFEMKKDRYGDWKLVPPSAKEMAALEPGLAAAIQQKEKMGDTELPDQRTSIR